MQYNDYKHTYRSLVGSHVHDLLRVDNNGLIPRLRPDYNNQYDNQAVYLGMPNFKYGYVAKKSFDHTSSEEYRELLHTKDFKDGLIESIVTRVNTDNVVYRRNESVTAHVVFYLKHPLYDVEKSYNVVLDKNAKKSYINSSDRKEEILTSQEKELRRLLRDKIDIDARCYYNNRNTSYDNLTTFDDEW
jgi:hypothetical protein